MTTDPRTIDATSAGQDKTHLSTAEAKGSARDDNDQQLQNFIAALGMRRPVDTDKAARLLEHVIKEAMSANIDWLEGQMRTDGWESALSNGETLTGVATRANAYLESPEGLELFNLFTKTFARTTGEIFD
ncbi:MAG: hypothetical protein JWP59_3433 [Massilia sp.]|jgi:hypothetical protein|nr:hypothetical protein [Massilia sp.]